MSGQSAGHETRWGWRRAFVAGASEQRAEPEGSAPTIAAADRPGCRTGPTPAVGRQPSPMNLTDLIHAQALRAAVTQWPALRRVAAKWTAAALKVYFYDTGLLGGDEGCVLTRAGAADQLRRWRDDRRASSMNS